MILVTGYKGFIGKNLVKRLANEDLFLVDIHNYTQEIPWDKITKIYHLGAISSTTETDIHKIYTLNIEYSISLFSKAIEENIPVVYASSASVYGNCFGGEINPLNYYSLSKATVDYWVKDNIEKFSNIVGLRFFNVYGDGEEHKGSQASPIYQFTKQAKENGVIKIFKGSKKYYRDFVWVEDCIDCMLIDKPSGIYDVGTSVSISFDDVANLIAEKYDASIEAVPFPSHLSNKYQYYTCAAKHYNKQFVKVKDYLNEI